MTSTNTATFDRAALVEVVRSLVDHGRFGKAGVLVDAALGQADPEPDDELEALAQSVWNSHAAASNSSARIVRDTVERHGHLWGVIEAASHRRFRTEVPNAIVTHPSATMEQVARVARRADTYCLTAREDVTTAALAGDYGTTHRNNIKSYLRFRVPAEAGEAERWLCSSCFAGLGLTEDPILSRVPLPEVEAVPACARCRWGFTPPARAMRAGGLR